MMLETIHEFAREKLQESGEAEELRRLHAEYFLALAEEAESGVEGAQQAVWLERLEEEHDNIRTALSWSLGQGGDAELALRMGAALGEFWYLRGYLGEGRRWLEEALAKSSPAPRAERARALYRVSWLAFVQGDLDRAVGAGEEGLELEGVELFRTGSGDSAAADLRRALAMAVVNRGEDERATGLLKESLALSREAGSIRGTAISHWGLGVTCMLGGDIGRAREFLEEALTLSRKSGDPWSIAGILTHLGDTFLRQGDLERATAVSEEAAAMLRELKYRDFLADALDNLGWAALLQGNPERARAIYAESLELRGEVGDDLLIPNTLQALASTAAALGEAERAVRLFGVVEMLNEVSSVDEEIASDELVGPYFATARSQLDETSWQEAWAEGRAMTLEEAISYALEEAGG